MRRFKILTALFAFWVAFPAAAQEIKLRSSDGSIQVSGTLLDFTGDHYRLQTVFGVMTLNSTGLICDGHGCPNLAEYAVDLSLSASSSLSETLIPALIDGYAFSTGQSVQRQQNAPGVWDFHVANSAGFPIATVLLTTSNPTSGFSNLEEQIAVISDVSRGGAGQAREPGHSASSESLTNAQKYILALDGLVLITSKENPVSSLTPFEIGRVFSGEIVNWNEIGGADAPIIVYKRGPDAAISRSFTDHIWTTKIEPKFASGLVFDSNKVLSDAVAANPLAIGYTNFANIGNSKPLGLAGKCQNEVYPTAFSLKTEDYPYTEHLYLFSSDKQNDSFTSGLMSYLDGPDSQRVIDTLGFVSRKSTAVPFDKQGVRLGNAITQTSGADALGVLQDFTTKLGGASRLSPTFRFKAFSIRLDKRSKGNSDQIAQLVERGVFDGKTVYIAGFSDDQGSVFGNQKISRTRASRVLAAIKLAATKADLSRVSFVTVGFGEVSPLACNDAEWGRRVNRRVEVWVK